MWINKMYLQKLLADNERLHKQVEFEHLQAIRSVGQSAGEHAQSAAAIAELRTQKAKDDISIDWMRHRVNALEKQNAILLQKAAGVNLPVPEIVPTRPGTMTAPDFDHLPSFEDVGDAEAKRLGISTDDAGYLEFRADVRPRSE